MDQRSNGAFADTRSGGGLFRGFYYASSTAGGIPYKRPGVPIDMVSRRELCGYFFEFFDETNELDLTNQWEDIDVGTMTLDPSIYISQGSHGGWLIMDSDATDGDGNWLSLTADNSLGYGLTPAAGRIIVCEYRFKHADPDAHHWFLGLIEDVGGSAGMDADGDMLAATEYVGFHHNDDDDADGIPRLIFAGGNNTEVPTAPTDRVGNSDTPAALAALTWTTLGVRIEGTTHIEWYINGALVGLATAASAFTAPLYAGMGSVMNAAAGDEFYVDYCLVASTRYFD